MSELKQIAEILWTKKAKLLIPSFLVGTWIVTSVTNYLLFLRIGYAIETLITLSLVGSVICLAGIAALSNIKENSFFGARVRQWLPMLESWFIEQLSTLFWAIGVVAITFVLLGWGFDDARLLMFGGLFFFATAFISVGLAVVHRTLVQGVVIGSIKVAVSIALLLAPIVALVFTDSVRIPISFPTGVINEIETQLGQGENFDKWVLGAVENELVRMRKK